MKTPLMLSPTKIIVDYELTIYNAFKNIYNNFSLVEYIFHPCQSW